MTHDRLRFNIAASGHPVTFAFRMSCHGDNKNTRRKRAGVVIEAWEALGVAGAQRSSSIMEPHAQMLRIIASASAPHGPFFDVTGKTKRKCFLAVF